MYTIVKSIFALAVYLPAGLGITLNYHYCGGHLVDIAFYHVDEDNCCGEAEEEEHNCCNNEYLMLDTDDSENPVGCKCIPGTDFQSPLFLNPFGTTLNIDYLAIHHWILPNDHAPPDISGPPSFIKHRVLII